MLLSDFNQASTADKNLFLMHCVHIPRWANEISEHGAFSSTETLYNFAKQQALTWTWDEIEVALSTHPRIGEKKAKAELSEKEQTFSNREQANITQDEETLEAIYKGNVAYEKKFGFIFLIKASGLNSEQILTALNYRLVNELAMEKRIVHQQLLEIALLRLAQEVSS